MEVLIMVGQLILGLSILVGLHEWGHLIAAKAFGMRVEKYSVGFPPKIFGKRIGETEYSIGAIPLGGFVKISGMVDESLDTKSLDVKPQPWEFRAKPAWQRLIVMMGGIIVNVITGIIIFIFIAFINGDDYLPQEELNRYGIVAYDLGEQLGFQTGDKIVSVNGEDFERFSDILSPEILVGSNNYFTVDRNGKSIRVDMPNDFIEKLADRSAPAIIFPRSPFTVEIVFPGSNADKGGLRSGDRFLAINGVELSYFDEFRAALDTMRSQSFGARVLRDGQELDLHMTVTEEGTVGFQQMRELNYVTRSYGFGEAVLIGTVRAFSIVWLNIKGINKIIKGEVSPQKSLSGPIRIATMFGGTWNWGRFWHLVGLLSMVLAFMNFLPIPALDGGHVAFLTWEIVTGRKPSDKFLEGAQKVGMVLLLTLMVFVIVNDTLSLF